MKATPIPIVPLGIAIALLVAQRCFELTISARHERGLRARGAVEFRGRHFAGIVALHALFPLALILEIVGCDARPPAFWPALLLPLAVAAAMRAAAMVALGQRWHVRIWVIPGEPPIRRGIYRWLEHPNYLAVALEFAVLPLVFGAWRTALAASAINAALLARRIAIERRALRWAANEAGPRPS